MKTLSRTFYGFIQDGKLVLSAQKAFKEYVATQFGDGDDVEITIQPKTRKRTISQNAALHAMLQPWCEEGYEIDDLKRDLMGTIFGWSEKVCPLSGQKIPLKPHTSELTVEEFSILIDRSLQLAAECGVYLLAPDEYRQQRAKKGAA